MELGFECKQTASREPGSSTTHPTALPLYEALTEKKQNAGVFHAVLTSSPGQSRDALLIVPILEIGTASFRLRFHIYEKEPPD